MSDAPFAKDFTKTFKSYVSTPASQVNLGYTLTSFWYTAAFYLGILMILTVLLVFGLNANLHNNNTTKRPLVVVAMVGVAMILFSLWGTVTSFYSTVTRINRNVKADRECSLFLPDTPAALYKKLASEATEDEIINTRLSATVNSLHTLSGTNEPTSTEQDIGD